MSALNKSDRKFNESLFVIEKGGRLRSNLNKQTYYGEMDNLFTVISSSKKLQNPNFFPGNAYQANMSRFATAYKKGGLVCSQKKPNLLFETSGIEDESKINMSLMSSKTVYGNYQIPTIKNSATEKKLAKIESV